MCMYVCIYIYREREREIQREREREGQRESTRVWRYAAVTAISATSSMGLDGGQTTCPSTMTIISQVSGCSLTGVLRVSG